MREPFVRLRCSWTYLERASNVPGPKCFKAEKCATKSGGSGGFELGDIVRVWLPLVERVVGEKNFHRLLRTFGSYAFTSASHFSPIGTFCCSQ